MRQLPMDDRLTTRRASSPAKCRRGVTLMEVLISIFILSVGLFGVAALIPVGGSEILEGVKADRSAAVGGAALRDVKVRRMLDPFQWDVNATGQASPLQMWYGGAGFNPDSIPNYILIDPLFIAANSGNSGCYKFPFATGAVTMDRVSFRSAPVTAAGALTLEGAREIFVSKDDALFNILRDKRYRARAIYRARGGSGILDEPTTYSPGVGAGSHVPDYEGDYSWMAMITPAPAEGLCPGVSNQPEAKWRSRVNCSVVVFYKRNLDAGTQPEVVASATINGGGYGGGDVVLTLAAPYADPKYFDRVRKNRWILLSSATGGPPPMYNLFQWYRVVAVAEDNPTSLSRNVTLAGPDWPLATAQAVLMSDVVGVFTEVIEVDRDLLRTR